MFFFRWKCRRRPKYPKKDKNRNIWRKKNKPKPKNIRERLGRGTLNTCAKFQGLAYLSKTAWTLDSEGIWGYMLEPASYVPGMGYDTLTFFLGFSPKTGIPGHFGAKKSTF